MLYNIVIETLSTQSVFSTCKKLCIWDTRAKHSTGPTKHRSCDGWRRGRGLRVARSVRRLAGPPSLRGAEAAELSLALPQLLLSQQQQRSAGPAELSLAQPPLQPSPPPQRSLGGAARKVPWCGGDSCCCCFGRVSNGERSETASAQYTLTVWHI